MYSLNLQKLTARSLNVLCTSECRNSRGRIDQKVKKLKAIIKSETGENVSYWLAYNTAGPIKPIWTLSAPPAAETLE